MDFYFFILLVLVGTAVADLYVGVANDAVNFLNSAMGSKAGSRTAIMVTASLGVIVGTLFSTGMMEVAQSGIFNPAMFTFREVMFIFLAVMLTDIILLDLYNSFGLPTSTTVSLVFELIGGAVAMSVIKISGTGSGGDVLSYLNTSSVFAIISGIGLSVLLAFIAGVLIQFVVRLIFTFRYEARFKRFGAVYAATSFTGIFYFILVKGAKGTGLFGESTLRFMDEEQGTLLLVFWLGLSILLHLLIRFTKVPVLRGIVFAGTFALALSFASNDLVNFIGAPMGALRAYDLANASGALNENLKMTGLNEPAQVELQFVLAAGLVMLLTLWFSKKARTVTKTEVSLGSQHTGKERFTSSLAARALVNMALSLHGQYVKYAPKWLKLFIKERINPASAPKHTLLDTDPPAFDMIRATTNLMVASALISLGTSLKLPLSTTFVTFMVAMATSLADKAWGRESAEFRVNGVLTVIGGWFVTALLAFSTCFLFTLAIYYGELPAILVLIFIGFFFYWRNTVIHDRREAEFSRKKH